MNEWLIKIGDDWFRNEDEKKESLRKKRYLAFYVLYVR